MGLCYIASLYCSMFVIHFVPETPPYLASKGKYHKAQEVLMFLRGDADEAEKEMTEVGKSGAKACRTASQQP